MVVGSLLLAGVIGVYACTWYFWFGYVCDELCDKRLGFMMDGAYGFRGFLMSLLENCVLF